MPKGRNTTSPVEDALHPNIRLVQTGDLQGLKAVLEDDIVNAGYEDAQHTLLMYAVDWQRTDIVHHLLASGADVSLSDNYGRDAKWYASHAMYSALQPPIDEQKLAVSREIESALYAATAEEDAAANARRIAQWEWAKAAYAPAP
tara:strand:- start:352 stop:786 length:435 start_codon:yes stop_codon:yes gene_type:complete